jgi:hypothetical protein
VATLGVVVLLAGCGGSKPAGAASELVPPSAVAFVSLDTDLGSLPRLIDRFPFGPKAVKAVRRALALKRSAGPEIDLAFFKGGMVAFTQPADQKAFEASLQSSVVHARVRGWTAYTDNPALLHLVQHHKGKLSEQPGYDDAFARLPSGAVVRAYVASAAKALISGFSGVLPGTLGASVPKVTKAPAWVSAAVSATGNDLKIELHIKGSTGPAAAESTSDLVSKIPAGPVLAIGLGGVGTVPKSLNTAGVDARAIADALGGQAIAYVRAGLPFPEVTIASKPRNMQKALGDVARLVAAFGKKKVSPVPVTVDGVTLQDVAFGAVDIYYGTFDDLLVVSDSTDAVRGLRSSGDKLTVPGLPDKTNGFLYLDVEHALPAVKAFAKLANQTVPSQVDSYLKPLRTVVVYGTRDADVQNVFAILQTR